jgi:hypothetical protein
MLSLIFVAGLVAANFPPAATYRYTASMAGAPIGSWSVTVSSSGGSTQLQENSAATIAGMQLSASATLALGPDLAPTRYDGHYRTPTQSPNVSVAVTGNSATVVGALGGSPQQIALSPNTQHFVVIEPGLLAGLFALPAQLNSWKESSVTWIMPATGQAQALSTTNATPAPTRPAGVPTQDVSLSIDRPTELTIWYDPATLVPDEILVPSQGAVLTRERS